MFSTLNLPSDIQERDKALSGAVSTLLNKFDTAEGKRLPTDALSLNTPLVGPDPVDTFKRLTRRAAELLIEQNIISATPEGDGYKFEPSGYLIPSPERRRKLDPRDYVPIRKFQLPIESIGSMEGTHFARKLESGAAVLTPEGPLGTCTGFRLNRPTGFDANRQPTWSLAQS